MNNIKNIIDCLSLFIAGTLVFFIILNKNPQLFFDNINKLKNKFQKNLYTPIKFRKIKVKDLLNKIKKNKLLNTIIYKVKKNKVVRIVLSKFIFKVLKAIYIFFRWFVYFVLYIPLYAILYLIAYQIIECLLYSFFISFFKKLPLKKLNDIYSNFLKDQDKLTKVSFIISTNIFFAIYTVEYIIKFYEGNFESIYLIIIAFPLLVLIYLKCIFSFVLSALTNYINLFEPQNKTNPKVKNYFTNNVLLTQILLIILFLQILLYKDIKIYTYEIIILLIFIFFNTMKSIFKMISNPFEIIDSKNQLTQNESFSNSMTENPNTNKVINKSSTVFKYGIILIVTLVFILYGAVYWNYRCFDSMSYNISPGKFVFDDLFYYTVISFTTIGYGDITPATWISRIISITISISSVVCLIIFVSVLISTLSNNALDNNTSDAPH